MPYSVLPSVTYALFYEISWVVSSRQPWGGVFLQVFSVLSSAIEARSAGGTRVRGVGWLMREWVRGGVV